MTQRQHNRLVRGHCVFGGRRRSHSCLIGWQAYAANDPRRLRNVKPGMAVRAVVQDLKAMSGHKPGLTRYDGRRFLFTVQMEGVGNGISTLAVDHMAPSGPGGKGGTLLQITAEKTRGFLRATFPSLPRWWRKTSRFGWAMTVAWHWFHAIKRLPQHPKIHIPRGLPAGARPG